MNKDRVFDLESRFISFSLLIMEVVDELPKTYTAQHLSRQLIRSGTSPTFQYAEAQAAETRKDFIQKLKIGLKELRETKVCLHLIDKRPLLTKEILKTALLECDELIAITFKSIITAQKNLDRKN